MHRQQPRVSILGLTHRGRNFKLRERLPTIVQPSYEQSEIIRSVSSSVEIETGSVEIKPYPFENHKASVPIIRS